LLGLVAKISNQAVSGEVDCEKKECEFETHMLSDGG
jgi:hypothetical protein